MTRIGDTYRWIYGTLYRKPTNFSWVIEKTLAGSGLPGSSDELEWLTKQGIKTIVTVRETPLPKSWIKKDVDYLHLNVEDYKAPTLEELDSIIEYIHYQLKNNKPTVVHCLAGLGRTGTILAGFIMKKNNKSYKDAIQTIRSKRPGSVQSEIQEMLLFKYEKYLTRK